MGRAMGYRSGTWPMAGERRNILEGTEKQMVQWMCDLSVRDRVPSEEKREIELVFKMNSD